MIIHLKELTSSEGDSYRKDDSANCETGAVIKQK